MPAGLILLAIKALAVAAALGALAWAIHVLDMSRQQIGYDRRLAEDNAALIEAQQRATEAERKMTRTLEDARNDATTRSQEIDRHAAAARTAAERLRLALDALRDRGGLPADPAAPGDQRTATLAELLGDCAAEYRGVAEKADRHASDARTLREGWPR